MGTLRDALLALGVPTLQARNDAEIAATLSVGRTRLRPYMIGVGTILEVFAGQGGVFLDTLATIGETDRDIHWLLNANIMRGEFDVGRAASRAGMAKMATELPQFAEGINALLELGVEPDPYTVDAVSDELNRMNDEGLLT